MKKILKNPTRNKVNTIFRGHKLYFGPKQSQVFDMDDEEERTKYFFWQEMYGFIFDITKRLEVREK